jgi:hypothetical protein
MGRKNQYIGGIIGASPVVIPPALWTPANLTDTPYVWMDADQGITNLGDGGTITIDAGWNLTSSQNGLTTVGNTNNSGRWTFTQANIHTTVTLIQGDSGWTTREYATMWSGPSQYETIGAGGTSPHTGVIDVGLTTVETWRHTRENGTQINWVSGDWGTKTTDWELYSFQSSSTTDPWTTGRFGSDRTFTGRHFSGYLAEALAFEEELSQSDIEKIEGYLMHKWGLEANLPSGHPYKSAAPTV